MTDPRAEGIDEDFPCVKKGIYYGRSHSYIKKCMRNINDIFLFTSHVFTVSTFINTI